LIEMLVALLIASIFFSIFVGVVMATFETLRSGDERTVAQQNARVALNYIANDIRHATEIAPLRLEAYKDWATGGFPAVENAVDPFDPNFVTEAWPIYRQSVDSDPVGYIDLSMDGAPGEGDEYEDFRTDGFPYDVRALAPNRVSLLFFGDTYYPNTQYWAGTGVSKDLDANALQNSTTGVTRVTYEHQLVPPRHPEVYPAEFSGRQKTFRMAVNRTNAEAIQEDPNDSENKSDFVIVRSFEMDNPRSSLPDVGDTAHRAEDPGLGGVNYQIRVDEDFFRQPLADHVLNMRFRYWHIKGNVMLEIRYDPEQGNIGGTGIAPNDGYYRYFDIYGNEIYVWYNLDLGQLVPLLETNYTQADLDNLPVNTFLIDGGATGDDHYQQGLLLFEGWKFVNAVSITIKTANNRTLDIYRSTINNNIPHDNDPTNDLPDEWMGFIDFGLGTQFTDPDRIELNVNKYDPFYQAADNVRFSTAPVPSKVTGQRVDLFDFVEPNINPNYNGSAFTTLQTFVVPPALVLKADAAVGQLRFGLRYKKSL